MTLNLAETSVVKSRLPVPHGANFWDTTCMLVNVSWSACVVQVYLILMSALLVVAGIVCVFLFMSVSCWTGFIWYANYNVLANDGNSFSFSAQKMPILHGFGHFCFWPKVYFMFSFRFRF